MDYLRKLFLNENRHKGAVSEIARNWKASTQSVIDVVKDLALAFGQAACKDIDQGNLESAEAIGEVAANICIHIGNWWKRPQNTPGGREDLLQLLQILSKKQLSNEKALQAVQAIAPLVDILQQTVKAADEIPLTEVALRKAIEKRTRTLSAELLVVAHNLAGEQPVSKQQVELNQPQQASDINAVPAAQAQTGAAVKALAKAFRARAATEGDAGRMSEMTRCYQLAKLLEDQLYPAVLAAASSLVSPVAETLKRLTPEKPDFKVALETIQSTIACLRMAFNWKGLWFHRNGIIIARLLQLITEDLDHLADRIRGGEVDPAEEDVYYCQKISPLSLVISKPVPANTHQSSAQILWDEGKLNYGASNFAAAAAFFKAAAKAKREEVGSDSQGPLLHMILDRLAESLSLSNQYRAAEEAYREEFRVWSDSQDPNRTSKMCQCLYKIGDLQFSREAYLVAEATYSEGLAVAQNQSAGQEWLQYFEAKLARCLGHKSA